jgi:hypothetical protein
MAMHDTIDVYLEAMFDGMGFPRDLFRGTMNIEQISNSIRLVERHYEWLYRALDGMLKFVAGILQRAMDLDEIKVRLKRPTMAYTAEWMQLKMQMAANREIPRDDVYPEMGISDPAEAAVRAVEEDQEIQRRTDELAAKFEKEKTQGSMADIAIMAAEQGAQDPAAAGGMPPGGGAPPRAVAEAAEGSSTTRSIREPIRSRSRSARSRSLRHGCRCTSSSPIRTARRCRSARPSTRRSTPRPSRPWRRCGDRRLRPAGRRPGLLSSKRPWNSGYLL